jgi:hypothetical protein
VARKQAQELVMQIVWRIVTGWTCNLAGKHKNLTVNSSGETSQEKKKNTWNTEKKIGG